MEPHVNRFSDKIILVTGAAGGQGAEEARKLVGEGATVVIADILDEQGTALASQLIVGLRVEVLLVVAHPLLGVTLVEALSISSAAQEERQGFDRLSPNGPVPWRNV